MLHETQFEMCNKIGPLTTRMGIVRLALNGEHVGGGRYAKRRGINTSVTIDKKVGAVAPFIVFPWPVTSSTTKLVAVGADAVAFIGPWNNYLYEMSPTYTTGKIWKWNPEGGGSIDAVDTFGLSIPTTSGTLKNNDGATPPTTVCSSFGGGFYAVAATSWDEVRKCESEPLFFTATKPPTMTAANGEVYSSGTNPWSSTVQGVPGPGWSIHIPAVTKDAAASNAYYYRARILAFSRFTDWQPAPSSDFAHLRFCGSSTTGNAWIDSNRQPPSRLLDYTYDVIPATTGYPRACAFEGCWLWGDTGDFTFYGSNPACPETYGGNPKSVLAEVGGNLLSGKSEYVIRPTCGPFVEWATTGQTALALCKAGCWAIHPGETREVFQVTNDLMWIGCVSRATVSAGADGAWWWLSNEGIVFWDGHGPPAVITFGQIDTAHADTPFAADLSGACGAYDVARREYVCVIPKLGGGQFALVVRGDRLPNSLACSAWRFGTGLATITGIGYDWANTRLVYTFGSSSLTAATMGTVCGDLDPTVVAWSTGAVYAAAARVIPTAANGLYYQTTAGGTASATEPTWPTTVGATVVDGGVTWICCAQAYDFGAEMIGTEFHPGGWDQAAVGIFANRTTRSQAPSFAVTIDHMGNDEEPTAGTPIAAPMTANKLEVLKIAGQNVSGRCTRLRFINTDVNPLEIRAVVLGTEEEINSLEGVHG